MLCCAVIYVQDPKFPSIPVSSPGISYFSRSENFSESKVILNFFLEVENGHCSLYDFQEDSLLHPYRTKSIPRLSSSPIQLCRTCRHVFVCPWELQAFCLLCFCCFSAVLSEQSQRLALKLRITWYQRAVGI